MLNNNQYGKVKESLAERYLSDSYLVKFSVLSRKEIRVYTKVLIQIVVLLMFILSVACTENEQQISFSKDVMPIFVEHCTQCHNEGGVGHNESGFLMKDYDSIMQGTKLGPVIQAGQSHASTLQILVEHKADTSINMPKGGIKLPKDKIEIIKKWIDQGAKNN